ncbi:SurA N-terminal domain-containing protein [Aestuariivirga sp.]|uniref:peptidylprolyl isomerase n=1 Tax=Aestuariivirga sp. TaxID=2650926 RepID=UPI00359454D8
MMESMRNAAKGWVAKVLIGLLAVSFGVWGIADVFTGYATGYLAKVGKTEISAEQYSNAFSQYLQNFSRQTGQALSPEDARKLGVDRAVLNDLIQTAAIDNEGTKLNLAVSDTYLAKDLMDNKAFQDASGKFDAEQFKRLLASNGLSEAAFFAGERQRLLREALTGTAAEGFPVSQSLLEAQYRHRNEQRDVRFFVVTTADTEVAAPTDDEIKAEYEANPAAYTAPEYRSIAVMKAEPADIASKVTLSEAEITEGYEKFKGEYFTPETRTILQISFPTLEEAKAAKDKLAAGADFMALAKERGFSEQDVTFADKTKADFLDPAIADAAFTLAEGAVSEPIKGALATVLVKAVKISPEHQATLDEVKAQLTSRLQLERAREEIQSIYDAVEDARAAQTKFEDIASKAGIPFQLIAASDASGKDKDGKDIDMPHKADLLRAAFTSDVGVENDAISLDDGYVWYEVREVIPSAVKPLDVVKEQARAAVISAKARAISEEKAKKLVERARGGTRIEELATEAGAEMKSAQGLRRNESDLNFDVDAVSAIFAVPENGFAFAVEPGGRSAKIMQSQAVLLPAFDPAAQDVKAESDRMKAQVASDALSGYLVALQEEAGVDINDTVWRNISGQQTQ